MWLPVPVAGVEVQERADLRVHLWPRQQTGHWGGGAGRGGGGGAREGSEKAGPRCGPSLAARPKGAEKSGSGNGRQRGMCRNAATLASARCISTEIKAGAP